MKLNGDGNWCEGVNGWISGEAGAQLLQAMFLLANSSKGNSYVSAAAQETLLCNTIKFDSEE